MNDCACGHPPEDHQHNTGRCAGQCHDTEYGEFKCVCPYYTQEKL